MRLAHQAVSGKQPLCQLWRHTSSCRRAIRTIFLIVLNYATRRGVIEHPIQRVRSKRSTRERLPRPCYHVRGFPITGFTMESYTLSMMYRTRVPGTAHNGPWIVLPGYLASVSITAPHIFLAGSDLLTHHNQARAPLPHSPVRKHGINAGRPCDLRGCNEYCHRCKQRT